MASEACELEETAVAEELEDTPNFADDELCGTLEEDGAVAELEATEELDTTDELEEFTEDELEATEELLFCSEELDEGASFLATPETANSGAWPALSASMAPAR